MPELSQHRTFDDSSPSLLIPMDYIPEAHEKLADLHRSRLTDTHTRAYELLEESAHLGSVDAAYTLADINMYRNWSFPYNAPEALRYYHRVVELEANASAYFSLGLIYATGLFGKLELNQAKANMYYQFAYEAGDLRAAMTLGYRNVMGIGMPTDLKQSMVYYQEVADTLKILWDKAPLGGPHLDSHNIRVSDWQDGIYGKGVGDVPSSLRLRSNRFDQIIDRNAMKEATTQVDYFYYRAMRLYEGSYLNERNYTLAFHFAKAGAAEGERYSGVLNKLETFYTARCLYLMGFMYSRGEGVTLDYNRAIKLLEEADDVYSFSAISAQLGRIYEFGPEELRNLTKAGEYYHKYGETTSSHAYQYGLYLLTYGTPDHREMAIKIIENAAHFGYGPAFYKLAELGSLIGSKDSYAAIIRDLKYYCEMFDPVITPLKWALGELLEARPENAELGYAIAAEMGLECAQSSAAFLLYSPASMLEDPPITTEARKAMSLVYVTRSSTQYNVDSNVLLGDMYFEDKQYEKALACYETASGRKSSQAVFNLGWLHEMGYGVEKDFYLAKRYYDMALSVNVKAYLPAQLALLRLRLKGIWANIWGTKSLPQAPHHEGKRTWNDWKDLYNKVRGKGSYSTFEPTDVVEDDVDDEEESLVVVEDLILLAFVLAMGIVFWLGYMYQQRQLRLRRERGDPVPPPAQADGAGGGQLQIQLGGGPIQIQLGFVAI